MDTENQPLLPNEDNSMLSESVKICTDSSDEADIFDKSTIDSPILFEDDKLNTSSIKRKSVKRSQLERELETNLTPKVTSCEKSSTPEGSSPANTSRYGRARKQKTIADFYLTDVAFQLNSKQSRSLKSPIKSPTKLPLKLSPSLENVKSPLKMQSTPSKYTSPKILENCTPGKVPSISDDYSPIEKKIIHTPWNDNPTKIPIKVYVRKDLIQRKHDEKEETGSLMMSMFSPIKSPPRDTTPKMEKAISAKKAINKSIEKQQNKPKKLSLGSPKEQPKRIYKPRIKKEMDDSVNVSGLNSSVDAEAAMTVNLVSAAVNNLSILQDEASSKWKLGDLAWARVGSHPFWPCLITRDPVCSRFIRKKTVGRSLIPVEVLHVTFFADCGRRAWLLSNFLMKFEGRDHFLQTKEEFTPKMKKKDAKFCAAFNISESKKSKWLTGVTEAEMLLRRPAETREQFFISMFLSTNNVVAKGGEKEKKPKIKIETSSDISLSESLFDSLFRCQPEEQEEEKVENMKIPVGADIIDLVDDCINSIAEKSGIVKIKTQSHMDRWLLKAKQPVKIEPEIAEKPTDCDAVKTKVKEVKATSRSQYPDKNEPGKPKSHERKTRSSKAPAEEISESTNDAEKSPKSVSSKCLSLNKSQENLDSESRTPKSVSSTCLSLNKSQENLDSESRTPKSVSSKCLSLNKSQENLDSESCIPKSVSSKCLSLNKSQENLDSESCIPKSVSSKCLSLNKSQENLDSESCIPKSVSSKCLSLNKSQENLDSESCIPKSVSSKCLSPNKSQENLDNESCIPKSVSSKCLSLKSQENLDSESRIPLKKRKVSLEVLMPNKTIGDNKIDSSSKECEPGVENDVNEIISIEKDEKKSSEGADDVKSEEISSESLENCDKEDNESENVATTPRIASLRKRKSAVTPTQADAKATSEIKEEIESDEEESVPPASSKSSVASKVPLSKYDDPEFQEFLEFKRDALLDENPELTEEYILSYLYKAWQYGENQRTEDKSSNDFCLVKGMGDEVGTPEPKRQRKRKEVVHDDTSPTSPEKIREKSSRKKLMKSNLVEDDSDFSDIEDAIKTNTISKSKPLDTFVKVVTSSGSDVKSEPIKVDTDVKIVKKTKLEIKSTEENELEEEAKDKEPVDYYMAALSVAKPSIFKGLFKEKVCEICEKPSGLIKCKGSCGGMYHLVCVQKQLEPSSTDDTDSKRTKKRKKRGRKSYHLKKKSDNDTSKTDDNDASKADSDCESGDDSQVDESISESFTIQNGVDTNESRIIQPLLNGEIQISPTKRRCSRGAVRDLLKKSPRKEDSASPLHIVTNAEDFESQLEKKMQELMQTAVPQDLDLSSASSTDGDADWDNVKAGECVIVDVLERKLKMLAESTNEPEVLEVFKCNDCQRYEIPPCFVCRSITCPKINTEERQKCSVIHCNKFYHVSCLRAWPQTKYSTGGPSKHQKKSQPHVEAVSCPRHVCHTCVSDDPRGCRTRFSGDKLVRCVKCPATYHSFTQCIPAGTKVITAATIVCPRHCDAKLSKIPLHVNTSWCFICAKGGSLICCETCPTSFHAECLKISPPEGGYICEDCETGRLPLYGELVWVKLGNYRWWPALVLHPVDVPPNIAALPHAPNQFAVRFFGDYDHYWVSGGRVFPYQEGDTGHASSKKSAVDTTFLTAIKQAQEAYDIIAQMKQQNSEEGELSSSLLPPQYVKLKVNRAVAGACGGGGKGSAGEGKAQRCDCNPSAQQPCAPDSDCLNRMLLTECSPTVCAAGERCENQAFEKRLYPPLAPSRTKQRGWGLKLLGDVKKGDFIIEYVGEVIDEAEFQRRMARRQEIRDENYYFLTLDKDRMIDAGPKGNVARFMNHSCEPNCETQKWTVNGDTRVGLFALKDLPAGTEVTFNYNLSCAGDDKKRCLCGAKRCAGFIGAKPLQDEPTPKKIKNIKVKRRNRKKPLPNTPTNSPVASSPRKRVRTRTPTSEKRRSAAAAAVAAAAAAMAAVVIVKEPDPEPEPKPEPKDDIENDVREIKKAMGKVEEKEKGSETSIESKDSDSPSPGKEVNPVLTNGDVTDDVEIDFIESSKSVKRKRVSLTYPGSDNLDKSLTNSVKKRARSNSVHFSETVTYINDIDVVSSSDKQLLISNDVPDAKLNGHLESFTTNGIDKDSVDFCKMKELNDKGKNLKVYRARTRKSLNNSVDEI